jgi:hypothetical protein
VSAETGFVGILASRFSKKKARPETSLAFFLWVFEA